MKKHVIQSFLGIFLFMAGVSQVNAQIYKNSLGLSIDAGDGATLVGPELKHFFNANSAGQIALMFGNHVTVIQPMYTYNDAIKGADGLNWFAGMGPTIAFGDHTSNVAIRPMAGLEYKIQNVPLDLTFDWRPAFWLSHGGGTEVARFGIGFRFVF